MECALEHGTLLEHKMFVPNGHAIGASWTFAVSFLQPAAQILKPAPLNRAEQIQTSFSDQMNDYVAGEKRRWELTVNHWDTDFIQLHKIEGPLSVYLRSSGGCQI